jgi:hypothetical protein
MPPSDLVLSTFRILNASHDELQRLGVVAFANRPAMAYGWGQIKGADVREVGLRCDPDNQPKRHVGIVDWPNEKDAQKQLALELQSRSVFRML